MKKLILFPERFILLIDMRSRNLERHILIRDFGNIRNKEYECEAEDEYSDC
jgi:hypothetical protein